MITVFELLEKVGKSNQDHDPHYSLRRNASVFSKARSRDGISRDLEN